MYICNSVKYTQFSLNLPVRSISTCSHITLLQIKVSYKLMLREIFL